MSSVGRLVLEIRLRGEADAAKDSGWKLVLSKGKG